MGTTADEHVDKDKDNATCSPSGTTLTIAASSIKFDKSHSSNENLFPGTFIVK